MRVILSSYTPDPTLAIARAAKTCYSDGDYEVVTGKVEDKDSREKMIKNIIDSGHGSCLEHAVFTFFVEGISRACTHQLVRHRIASYEQRSQRYVNEDGFDYIVPCSVYEKSNAETVFTDVMKTIKTAYNLLIKQGVPKEDARYVLPNACTSTIVITMNLRSLRNFFELRMCNRAQWEIQELAETMYNLVEEVDPILVYKSGPKCVTSECTEKNRTPRCPYEIGDYNNSGLLRSSAEISDNPDDPLTRWNNLVEKYNNNDLGTDSDEKSEERAAWDAWGKELGIPNLGKFVEEASKQGIEPFGITTLSPEETEEPKHRVDFSPNANLDPNEWWDKWNKPTDYGDLFKRWSALEHVKYTVDHNTHPIKEKNITSKTKTDDDTEDDEEVEAPDFGKIDMSKYMKGSSLTSNSERNK